MSGQVDWADRTGRSSAASAYRRFQLHKRRQLFIGTHNETLSVAAMCVRNPAVAGGLLPSKSQRVETRTADTDTVRTAPESFNSRKWVAEPFRVPHRPKYEARTVAVSGKITLYHGKPEIVVNSPSQLAAK
jgi:hypothetical protein